MFIRIRSRNASARQLYRRITSRKRGVYRAGSYTPTSQIFTERELSAGVIEINKVEACRKSGDKIVMKKCFDEWEVRSANWCQLKQYDTIEEITEDLTVGYGIGRPYIVKHKNSSRGNDIFFLERAEDLFDFCNRDDININNYIVEHWYSYVREYRLHVDKFGCFLAHRKMLRNDAQVRWHRHHENSVWINEDNEDFARPDNWETIVEAAQKARRSVGLDICSVDVKVAGRRDNPDFIILETNSGSALGEDSAEKYVEELQKIANDMNAGIYENFERIQDVEFETETESEIELSEEETNAINLVQNAKESELKTVTQTEKSEQSCCKQFAKCPFSTKIGLNFGHCSIKNTICEFIKFDSSFYRNDDEDDDEEEGWDEEDV